MDYERKGLGRKNQLYSVILAVVLLGCLLGYFICMLPSLYVSYRMEQNLKTVELQHRAYMETGSYDGVKLANPMTSLSVEIPYEGDSIFMTGQYWRMELSAEEEYIKVIFSELRQLLHQYREGDFPEDHGEEQFAEEMEERFSRWKEMIEANRGDTVALPVRIDLETMGKMEYVEGSIKLHRLSTDVMIIESVAGDGTNIYTSYFAVEDTGESMVFTILSAMTPDMGDIRPVVLQSIPMLAAVVLLLVLLFSGAYSKGILKPIYRELEEKNQALLAENKRQEIFMRASSHQLKTPLSAALLLLDGMIGRVGKYAETQVYLPKVKEQLLSMRRMVEDILSLNHCRDNFHLQSLQIMPLVEERLQTYKVAISDKGLQVSCTGVESAVMADEYLLQQILDNLISNAVEYTPAGNKIEIFVSQTGVSIENYGAVIPEEILPHIFDPFVSGNHERNMSGHGLGLYIASYYAGQMDFSVSIENREDRVLARLCFS